MFLTQQANSSEKPEDLRVANEAKGNLEWQDKVILLFLFSKDSRAATTVQPVLFPPLNAKPDVADEFSARALGLMMP